MRNILCVYFATKLFNLDLKLRLSFRFHHTLITLFELMHARPSSRGRFGAEHKDAVPLYMKLGKGRHQKKWDKGGKRGGLTVSLRIW